MIHSIMPKQQPNEYSLCAQSDVYSRMCICQPLLSPGFLAGIALVFYKWWEYSNVYSIIYTSVFVSRRRSLIFLSVFS